MTVKLNFEVEVHLTPVKHASREDAEAYLDSLTRAIDCLLGDLDLHDFPVEYVDVRHV